MSYAPVFFPRETRRLRMLVGWEWLTDSGSGVVPMKPAVEVPTPSIGRDPERTSADPACFFRLLFVELAGMSFFTIPHAAKPARTAPIIARKLKFLYGSWRRLLPNISNLLELVLHESNAFTA